TTHNLFTLDSNSVAARSAAALLGLAALDDELVAAFVLLAGLLALGMTPRALEVLTATAGFRLALAPTVGVVDGVHGHATHGRAHPEPAAAAGLPADDLLVLDVAHCADGGVAARVDAADLAGRQLDEGVAALA